MKYKHIWVLLVIWFTLLFETIQINCSVAEATSPNCDPRCNGTCTVHFDQNFCCQCMTLYVSVHHIWWNKVTAGGEINGARCSPTCPTKFWPKKDGYPYQCQPCDTLCQTCSASGNTSCYTCISTAYQQGVSTCSLLTNADNTNDGRPYQSNPCYPPYYGIFPTKKCQPCPTGCSMCNIFLTTQMPAPFNTNSLTYQWNTPCTDAGLCQYAIMCYSCYTPAYALQQGLCITTNRCRKYSLYNSSTSGFNSAYCYCMTGFYLTGVSSCSICHYTCKTCTGPADTDCTKCHTGATKSGACVANTTYEYIVKNQIGLPSNTTTQAWTTTKNFTGTSISPCNSTNYVFGYYGYDSNSNSLFGTASITFYSNSIKLAKPHYGIHFRAQFLFIDQWYDGMSILFTQNNIQRYAYRYNMQNVIGQYFCGRTFHDHRDMVDFTFSHTRSDNINLSISVPYNRFAWGMRKVIIGVLLCDTSCASCNGPLPSNCLTCPTNQVVFNGDCVCNTAGGYFNDTNNGSLCQQNCTNNYYMNPVTLNCTLDCSAASYLFKYTDPATFKRYCYQNCPSGTYKYYPTMTCVSDCYNTNSIFYNFKGNDKVCYQNCPDGYYGDSVSHDCVTQCPLTPNTSDNANNSYYVLGKICVQRCSATTYAYSPNRTCLTSCPTGFYKNKLTISSTQYNICQDICTITLSGTYKLADNTTGWCVDQCPAGGFADYILHVCVSDCNSTSFQQTLSISSNLIRTCQTKCNSAVYQKYGNKDTGKCVDPSGCPLNTYGDPNTTFCQDNCTDTNLYGDNFTRVCQSTCNNGYFKQNYTKRCVKTCPLSNFQVLAQYGDKYYQGYFCVASCILNTYADFQNNRQCVFQCKSSPVSTFGQNNNICVFNCSSSRWGDPNQNRTCVNNCTWISSGIKSYGQNKTRNCVSNCPDTTFGIGLNLDTLPLCLYVCPAKSVGTFGNPDTNLCVDKCPQPYYGDPTGNRTCVQQCPDTYYAQNTTATGVISSIRICVQTCDFGWADNITRKCATSSVGCSADLFAHQTNHKCVIPMECTGFADPLTRKCIPTCQANSTLSYYGDPYTKRCVLECPDIPNYYGDNNTHTCVYNCTINTTQVRDPQYQRRCVTSCSRTPLALFFDVRAGLCVPSKNCTSGTFADNSTNKCQQDCQNSIYQYADPVSGQCVMQCELGWYGYNKSTNVGACVTICPLGDGVSVINHWADNITVLCTTRCSPLTYGVNYTNISATPAFSYGICQSQCPEDQFARDTDNLCVPNCGSGLWGNNDTNRCVTSPFDCPTGQYADNQTHMCVLPIDCSTVGGIKYAADNTSRSCLSQCPPFNVVINWADMDKQLCVAKCPTGYYGYNSTRVCQLECRDSNTSSWVFQFADPQLQICLNVCSGYPISTFGETITFTCVQAMYCPPETWAQVITSNRRCISTCPNINVANNIPQNYADNITRSCVTTCPTYFYGDIQRGYGMCVDVCPQTNQTTPQLQFSDNFTKTCVTICPQSQNTFGDVISLRCVLTCPQTYFAQQVPVRHCVQVCANDTWGNQVVRFCQTSPFNCQTINGTHFYADNHSHLCVQTCPASQNTWGENSTWVCQVNCSTGFKYNLTRVCIDQCPASLDGDGSFSDRGMCYFTCMTPGYYRDPQYNRSCQPICSFTPQKYYGDQTTWRCVLYCPVYPRYYYAYDLDKICRIDCPSAYMRDPYSRKCVDSCPNNTFFDPNSDQCVQQCPTENGTINFYGDSIPSIPICVISNDCSNETYADQHIGVCVSLCTDGQWKYQKLCVTFCPHGYYGNQQSGFCVEPLSCPTNHYAENYTRTCVRQCNGTFADTNLKVCVTMCPTNYFADSYTRLCSLTCTNNSFVTLHRDFGNRTCVSACSQFQYLNPLNNNCEDNCSYPYYADRTTQMCVTVCPSSPPLYADNHTFKCTEQCQNESIQFKYIPSRTCVPACPPTFFRDNITRFCVIQCDNYTYADDTAGDCVYNCSPRYSLDDPISVCLALCPTPYYRDTTTFTCVLDCPTSPVQYFKAINGNDSYCDIDCPTDEYRDFLTYSCVSLCPPSPPTYADNSSGNCVAFCPSSPDLYANLQTRKCIPKCPDGMFAENVTRTCVYKCPQNTNLYADNNLTIPYCVHLCSTGFYADPYTLTCTDACNNDPQTYGFDNTTVRLCVESCPFPYIADNTTYTCVVYCGSTERPYLDKASKSCVSNCSSLIYRFSYMPLNQIINGTCVTFCPFGFFAYLQTSNCVRKCPNGWYGDITNNTCYQNCTLANNRFADPTTNMCVDTCPFNSSFDSYGDLFTRKCVENCPLDKFTVKDTHTRLCQPSCTRDSQYIDYTSGFGKCVSQCPQTPLRFGDNVSQICVFQCSLYSGTFGYITTRVCVLQCPVDGLYANANTRLCVTARYCPNGTYGLDPQRICVQTCPTDRDYYADLSNKICTALCPTNYYSDPSTQTCVQTCPIVPSLYGKLSNQRCLAFCPDGFYADNQTRKCTTSCSLTPVQQYADNSTNICVQICPTSPNYFSQNITYTCVQNCPSPMFADYTTRRCVKFCPRGNNQTFADNSTRQCVLVCPNGTYMQNSTGTCVSQCTQGYSDPISKFCIQICPAYHYGLMPQRTCLTICPNATSQLYAEDNTHMCQTDCLQQYGTFKDDTTKRCVHICPIAFGLFAEHLNRKCVSGCLRSPKSFADNTTRSCVSVCPMIPALFGENDTLKCLSDCPGGTYADNLTRMCVQICPDAPDTYGDNSTWSCVSYCPSQPYTWADNYTRTCVPVCPSTPDYYADNVTGKCVYVCTNGTFADPTNRRCVTTCPLGYFGRNATLRCVRNCSIGQFADHLLRLCVVKCSVDPIFYGNPDTNNCVQECPNTTYSFGNPLTQKCVKYQNNGFSGCPNYYYSDNTTRLCVKVCPLLNDTYGDNSTWKCVSKCPSVPNNTFSDNSTMMCVSVCPQYPQYYAEIYSRRCVSLCLAANLTYSGSFADNSTRICVERCPQSPDYYSDNSTRRCVLYCPKKPLTFADNSTRRCVTTCPSSPDIYGDLKTLRCVPVCPQEQATYADYSTRLCVKVCPASTSLFGNNDTNRCVHFSGCPNNSFADNSSRLCVAKCPQYPQTYGDFSTKRCVQTCPSNPDLYADPFSQECVLRCPNGTYAENTTRRCMPQCPQNLVNFADNLTNRCVAVCPQTQATYGDNSTRRCVTQCPDTPFTYADNITRICLRICINISTNVTQGGYAENLTRVCVLNCPDRSYGDILSRYCVRYCPNNYYAYTITNMCVRQCPSPFFGDNSTWKCVLVCPVSQLFFGQTISRTCTSLCPLGTYADSYSQQCVNPCPGPSYDTYAYEAERTCVHECPYPLYAYPVTWVCRIDCPDPYYQNITDHRCYKCPNECAKCTYPQNCIICVPNHYLYAGMCLQSCPSFPTITYANPNGVCGTAFQCTSGYFALNITKSCVRECPSGFYKNSTLQACDSCLTGCSLCINSIQCITCNSALALWDDNKCYLYCSPLRRYYTSVGCVSTCPTGYYLNLVTCHACSSICKSCVVQAQNCLTCADGYYLSNNLCISECPQNTKAVSQNNMLFCKSCNITDCTKTPLTYQVTQFVDNFHYKFKLKFSQKVNITQQISKVIRIRQKTVNRRFLQQKYKNTDENRLLQQTYSNIDYTIVDYGNGEYDIILNNFDTRENADMQFSFQITNPQAIVSESGQFPRQTRTSVTIQSSDFYSINDYNQHMANYAALVAIISVILLVLTFYIDQSIWIPIIDFYHMLFVLLFIDISIPPNPAYVLSKSKFLILSFLPNMFTQALPKVQYDSYLTNTIYSQFGDLIFLRTMGFLYTILLVLGVIFGIMGILWKKGKWKNVKQYCKTYLVQRLPKRDLNGYVYLFFTPILVIGLLKMKNYNTSTPIQGFSIFSSFLFMIFVIAVPIYFGYKIFRLFRDNPSTCKMLIKAYEYITTRQVILQQNPLYYFSTQNNQIDLKQLKNPRINQLLILPYPIMTRFGNSQIIMPIIQYMYKLLIAIFIVAAYDKGTVQLFLILIANLINLIYFIKIKPYYQIQQKQYNNNIMIHNLISFIIIITLMIVLQLRNTAFTYDTRVLIGNFIAGFIIYAISVNLLYFIYRTWGWYHQHVWKPFIQTELFKTNYTIQYWQYKKQYQAIDKQNSKKCGVRQQFLQAIKLQNKHDGLESMVKKDPNSSANSKTGLQNKKQSNNIHLRPNRNEQFKKQVSNIFKNFNQEKQKSNKSIRSSQRLSKQQRNKVRQKIFGEKNNKKQQDLYEPMKIQEKQQENEENRESSQSQQTQYEYQYIDEEYPQGTDVQEIMKGCIKGSIVLP